MRRVIPKLPSRRETRNMLAFMAGETTMEAPAKRARAAPKRQPEAAIGEANRAWASLRGGVLRKNPRGTAGYMPPGMPVGLTYPLILDEIGYVSLVITPQMVGRRVAVFMAIEDKTKTGVASDEQKDAIKDLLAAGAIAGVSRSVEDSEAILARWESSMRGDER